MNIGTDYSTPVTVDGFSCKNCTDVDYAKKHIDPAHPKTLVPPRGSVALFAVVRNCSRDLSANDFI